jgi:hypothetical protein
MKLLSFLLVLLGIPSLRAQQNGIEQSLDLMTLPTGGKVIHWYGHTGRSYFVQVSDPTSHLSKWNWAPIIEGGNDEGISHQVGGTPNKGFFRLKYTDQVPGPAETLDTADFDDDGLTNHSEITTTSPTDPQTDPLNPDTDGDGMQDGWEVANGLDPTGSGGENGAAGDPDGDGLTNAQEAALGTKPNDADSDDDGLEDGEEVQRGTGPNIPDSDEDGLQDGEDADPRDNAITWKPASEPGYAFLEIEGWDQFEHGDPIMTNKKGQILCQKAVWENETWTKLTGAWTGINSPPVIVTNTWKGGPESEAQSIELYSAQATSIDDNGAIAGYASGVSWRSYQGNLPLAWDSAGDASPVALGVPDVIMDDSSNYDEDDVAHVNRDGVFTLIPTGNIIHESPIHTMRRYLASSPLAAIASSPSDLRCYGNSTVGQRLSRDGTCVGRTYGDDQPWVWRGSGAHEIISGSNTEVPLYYLNITQAPINLSGEIGCIGTTPPTGASDTGPEHPAISLGGSVLIHNGTKWVKSKSLQGASALSKSGTALTYEGTDPAVWRNTKVAKITDLCLGLEDRNITDFTPIDINDQGVILIKYQAPPPASNDIFRIGLVFPVEIRVRQDPGYTGPHGSKSLYQEPRPQNGFIKGEVFSLWDNENPPGANEEAYVTIGGGLGELIDNGHLPANSVKWEAPGHSTTFDESEFRVEWGATGQKEVKLTVFGEALLIHFTVPDVGSFGRNSPILLVDVSLTELLLIEDRGEEVRDAVAAKYGTTGGTGGARQDAIRHSTWNAVVANILGLEKTLLASRANEYTGKVDAQPRAIASNTVMDLNNNYEGAIRGHLQLGHNLTMLQFMDQMEALYDAGNALIKWIPHTNTVEEHHGMLRWSTGERLFDE